MITYQRLWETMKKRGITQYHLIKREKFSAGQIGRLKNNQTVSTQTLDTLCRLLFFLFFLSLFSVLSLLSGFSLLVTFLEGTGLV